MGDRGADERHVAGDAQVVDVATAVRDQPWVLNALDPSAEDAAGHVTLSLVDRPVRPDGTVGAGSGKGSTPARHAILEAWRGWSARRGSWPPPRLPTTGPVVAAACTGRDAVDGAFVIQSCRWVHTFGMRFPIDVAFVDDGGVVVKIMANAHQARTRHGGERGSWVIEARPAGAFERWGLAVGDVVELRDGE